MSPSRLVVTLLVGGVVGAAAMAADVEDPVRIVVLPMIVHTAESPDYLREGLADMLASRLEQVDALEVLRVERVEAATSSLSAAIQTGRKAKADFVLFGSFTRFGQGASLDVQCAATYGEGDRAPLREIFVHSGNIGDVIPDLDDLVGKVSRFVIQDFDAQEESRSPAAVQGEPGELQELKRRVEALEEALGRLQESSSPSPASVGDSPRTEASLR